MHDHWRIISSISFADAGNAYACKVDAGTRVKWRGHFRVTVEITSRVIVVAAHNGSGNSSNGKGKEVGYVRRHRAAGIHKISDCRIS